MKRSIPSFIACLLTLSVVCGWSAEPAASASKVKEQPMTPGGKWLAKDLSRPLPLVITPPTSSTPEKAGQPPSDAQLLFDGRDLSLWIRQPRKGDPDRSDAPKWKIENGFMEVVPKSGSIVTKDKFADCQIHLEWATPAEVVGDGQGRGNSGVHLGGFAEVQVLDSFGNTTYADGQAGSLYAKYPPLVNASRPPGEWQTYDIIFYAPRFDGAGKLTRPALITVLHNGVLIHHATPSEGTAREITLGLQDHLNPVRYRNIWVRKLKDYDER